MRKYAPGEEFRPKDIAQLTGGWKNWLWLGAMAFLILFNYLNPAGLNPIVQKAQTNFLFWNLSQSQADSLGLFTSTVLTPILMFVLGVFFMASTIARRWKMIKRDLVSERRPDK